MVRNYFRKYICVSITIQKNDFNDRHSRDLNRKLSEEWFMQRIIS